jgi:hypothetical protein
MKSAKAGRDEVFHEIVEALRSVPRSRLRIVRDFVGALGKSIDVNRNGATSARREPKAFLKHPSAEFGKDGGESATGGRMRGR